MSEASSTLPDPPKSASLPPRPQTNGESKPPLPDRVPLPDPASDGLPPTPTSASHAPMSDDRSRDERDRNGDREREARQAAARENNPQGRKIFIAQLPDDTTEEDLSLCFGAIGPVVHVELKKNFGFVEFKEAADATKACAEYDGGKFLDATIHVSLSHGAGGQRRGEGPSHCYRCGQEGHWANSKQCPMMRDSPARRERDSFRPDRREDFRRDLPPLARRDDRFPGPRGAGGPPDRNYPQSAPPGPDYPYPYGAPPMAAPYGREPVMPAAPGGRVPYAPAPGRDPYGYPPLAPAGRGGDFRDPYQQRDARGPPQYGRNVDRRPDMPPGPVPAVPVPGYPPYPYDPYRDPRAAYPYPPEYMQQPYYAPPPADFYGGPTSAPLPFPYEQRQGFYGASPRGQPSYLPRPRSPTNGGRPRDNLNGSMNKPPLPNDRRPPGPARRRSMSPPPRRMDGPGFGDPTGLPGRPPLPRDGPLPNRI